MNRKVLGLLMAIVISLSLISPAYAAPVKKKAVPPKIIAVKNVSMTINQDACFNLPAKVKATLSNKKVVYVAVSWDKKNAKTDDPRFIKMFGTVKGYSKKVTLIINIKLPQATIKAINNISETVIQGENYMPPRTVGAQMSDGTLKEVSVKWDKGSVDTTTNGAITLNGNVNGYKEPIKLDIKINGPNIAEPAKEYREAQVGDIVGIEGQLMGYTYIHYGIYIGDDTVIHYSSPTGKYSDAVVMESKMSERFPKGRYFVLDFKDKAAYSTEETVERAKSRLGEKKYDLISDNCEHFAIWAKMGVSKSFQIDSATVEQINLLKQFIKTNISVD